MDDIASILERLKSLEESMKRIEAALCGCDPIMKPGEGLLNDHNKCSANVSEMEKRLKSVENKVEDLASYKKEIKAYAAGIVVVVTVAWELITHFVKF